MARGAGLRPTAKAVESPPDPKVHAPVFYPTGVFWRGVAFPMWKMPLCAKCAKLARRDAAKLVVRLAGESPAGAESRVAP